MSYTPPPTKTDLVRVYFASDMAADLWPHMAAGHHGLTLAGVPTTATVGTSTGMQQELDLADLMLAQIRPCHALLLDLDNYPGSPRLDAALGFAAGLGKPVFSFSRTGAAFGHLPAPPLVGALVKASGSMPICGPPARALAEIDRWLRAQPGLRR